MVADPTGRSLTEWAVLGFAAEGETHGFSLSKHFTPEGAAGRIWTVPRPLVYRAIESLVREDLVERVGSEPGAGGPERKLLRVTPDGKRALAEWLEEPVVHVRDARSHLLMKLLLLDRAGRSPERLARRQRKLLATMVGGVEKRLAAAEGFDAVLLRWRLYSIETLDRFLTELGS